MKKSLSGLITLIAITFINWLAAFLFTVAYIEFSFLIGLAAVILIGWFTSSGGFSTDAVRMQTQGDTGIRMETEARSGLRSSTPFFVALAYTVLALIITIYYYRDYFFQ
ncbi:hypothetical protein [uncultured Marinococcus sp.]|jgi:hypothetical protein|uniref:hypothetical protein n=1 Tax=uncultured Marinococcus sp. TaxID=487012 RepID=UPI00262350B5|nr:hypothetical protein [uncultured Marinococcus sp.]